MTKRVYDDGPKSAVNMTYDSRNRVSQITSPHLTLDYTYGGEGNVLSINADTFGYDGLHRLTLFAQGGVSTSYQYEMLWPSL